jgi:hypothetical protein
MTNITTTANLAFTPLEQHILGTLISEQQVLRDRRENISVHSLVVDTEGVGSARRVAEPPGLDVVMEVGCEMLPRRPELSFKGR